MRGFYETQGTSRSSLIPWAAGRKSKARLLGIVHEESETSLMKGTVR